MGKRLLTRTEDGPRSGSSTAMSARRVGGSRHAAGGERDGPLPLRPDTGAQDSVRRWRPTTATRSNDGRADPFGGFWIGTMGKNAEAGAGALYRYYRGEVVELRDGYHHPERDLFRAGWAPRLFRGYRGACRLAHLARRRGLAGRPVGGLAGSSRKRDQPRWRGRRCEGRFWCAEWGGHGWRAMTRRKTCRRNRARRAATHLPGLRRGGPVDPVRDHRAPGPADDEMDAAPRSGMTLSFAVSARGQAEHRVIL
jgi:hypothetical protein